MEELSEIELLKKVKRVDAPPFLRTRIDSQIKQHEVDSISDGWVWSFAATFVLLFVLNSIVFMRGTENVSIDNNKAYIITQDMGMNVSNQLYND